MAQVDPSQQVDKSHQVVTLHSSILGDIVDSEPWVGSHRIISFCRYSTWHVSGECWPYLRNEHWTRIRMNLDDDPGGDIEHQQCWFERALTEVSVTHSQLHRTPPNAGGSYLSSSLQSPQWGLILRHCELCLRTCLRAADTEGSSS